MTDTFQTNQPIYLQLVERIKKEIMRDELKPGDKLPSVRELAVQSGVNPNTVQRTYRELILSKPRNRVPCFIIIIVAK